MNNYTSLHVHTHYSLLDGMCKIPQLVTRAKELGMTSLAVTEHGHLGSALVFREECKQQDIKPINGIELYMTKDMNEASKPVEERDADTIRRMIDAKVIEDKAYNLKEIAKIKKQNKEFEKYAYDMRQYHLILLAMNQQGWNNLVKIQSIAAEKCTYNGRFLADPSLLAKYNEGIICTTACVAGIIPSCILKNNLQEAKVWIQTFKDIFQDRFYLEIQPICLGKQILVNAALQQLSEEMGVEPVATTDVHYVMESDWDDHDTYLCISTGKLKTDVDRLKYSNDFWLHSLEELNKAFVDQEDFGSGTFDENYLSFWKKAIQNTNKIADLIEDKILIGSKKTLYPKVNNIPKHMTSDEVLYAEVWKGYIKFKTEQEAKGRYVDENLYLSRMKEEMSVITKKHYSDYFLMVQEYVSWGNSINPDNNRPNCRIGPGRGSAAGSLVLFFLGVTKANPIEHDLMFSRFLTVDRTSPPDIDEDLEWSNRDNAIKHMEEVYGKDHVAHIGTWTTESIYTGLKDFARVLNVPFSESNNITKELQSIIDAPSVKFKDFDSLKDENEAGYKRFKELEKQYSEIFRLARKFEGCCRQWGTHASGILVTPEPISDLVPTRVDKVTGDTVTLFTGVECEEILLIKLDFLGLKTITIFERTLQSINMDWDTFYDKMGDYDDPEVYKMLQAGKTDGIFQFESDMMTGIIKDIKPTSLDDLAAITALGRPGPLTAGYPKLYAECKSKGKKVYPIRGCEDILDSTYSVMIFQEQCMLISKKIAGFNDMQADSITRKILGKKKAELMPMMIRCHIFGKKNCVGPKGWEKDDNAPWYDPKAKYGDEIPGAISNGYTEKEVRDYFDTIMGFASYAFNRSHAVTYSQLSYMGAWLKCYYPSQFMAAVLSMQDKDEKKAKYIKVCREMGIKITVPDINLSGENFTPIDDETISYGLSSVKGVKNVSSILENRPFSGIEDAVQRLPKKSFNKTVGSKLIKAGAFDALDGDNRNATLNKFYKARKDKDTALEDQYTKEVCISYEIESIGSNITFRTMWEKMLPGQRLFNTRVRYLTHRDYKTKGGQMMAYGSVLYEGLEIPSIVFPKAYKKISEVLIPGVDLIISGSRSKDKEELIIDQAIIAASEADFMSVPTFNFE